MTIRSQSPLIPSDPTQMAQLRKSPISLSVCLSGVYEYVCLSDSPVCGQDVGLDWMCCITYWERESNVCSLCLLGHYWLLARTTPTTPTTGQWKYFRKIIHPTLQLAHWTIFLTHFMGPDIHLVSIFRALVVLLGNMNRQKLLAFSNLLIKFGYNDLWSSTSSAMFASGVSNQTERFFWWKK